MLTSFGMLVAQFYATGHDEKEDEAKLTRFWPRVWKNQIWFFGLYTCIISTWMVGISFGCFDDNLLGVPTTVETWTTGTADGKQKQPARWITDVDVDDPTDVRPADWNATGDEELPWLPRQLPNPNYYAQMRETCEHRVFCEYIANASSCVDQWRVGARRLCRLCGPQGGRRHPR